MKINTANGVASSNHEYGPFGEVIRATGPMAKLNHFRFSTKYQDDETDMDYYGYRFYDSAVGKWLSRDLIDELGGVNLYAFVDNDGNNNADAYGDTIIVVIQNVQPPSQRPKHIKPGTVIGETWTTLTTAWTTAPCCPGKAKYNVDGALDIYYWYWTPSAEIHEEHHVQIWTSAAFNMDNELSGYLGICEPICIQPILNQIIQYWMTLAASQNDQFDCQEYGGNCSRAKQEAASAKSIRDQINAALAACLKAN